MATLSKGIKVVAVDKVSGSSWKTTCAGSTSTGSSWYKITVANGKDVRSRFGLSAVYAASSLFKKLYSMSYKKAACDGVNVRTSASTGGTKKASLSAGTEGDRDRHRLRRQLERDLRRRRRLGLVLVQDQPGQRQEHLIAVRRLGDLWREGPVHEPQLGHACVDPQPHAAAQLDPGPRRRRRRRRAAISRASTSATGRRRSTGSKVAGAGKKFAFIKATESTDFLDNKYAPTAPRRRRTASRSAPTTSPAPGPNSGDAVNEAELVHQERRPDLGRAAPGPRPRGDRRPHRQPARDLDEVVHGPCLHADRRQGRDLRLAQLLVQQRRQLDEDRASPATRSCGSPTGRAAPRRPCRAATGAATAGRSGSTPRAAR